MGLHTKNDEAYIALVRIELSNNCVRLRSNKNKKVTFAVHTNRMKPYLDPALRPIEDDLSESYLDESNIPADFLEVSESISHDNDTNVTAENDTHSLLPLQEDPDISSQQVDHNQVTVAIDNQSIFAAKKKTREKKSKRKSNIQYKFKWLSYP